MKSLTNSLTSNSVVVKKLLFLFLSTASVLLMTCQQRTVADVYKDLQLEIPEEARLFADSVSSAVVEVDFGRTLLKEQEVTITTSKGLLFAPPYTPAETATASNTVTLQPFDDWAEVLLVSHTLTPTDPVHVTVTVNDLSVSLETQFQQSLPEDMQLDTDTPVVNANMDEVTIIAELFRETGFTSNGIRFVPSAVLEMTDPAQTDTLDWRLPDFVSSQSNEVVIPLRVLQHVPGSTLRVSLRPFDSDVTVSEKSTLLHFE